MNNETASSSIVPYIHLQKEAARMCSMIKMCPFFASRPPLGLCDRNGVVVTCSAQMVMRTARHFGGLSSLPNMMWNGGGGGGGGWEVAKERSGRQYSRDGTISSRVYASKEQGHVYSNPKVYDIAFSFRDFESEASCILEAYSALNSEFPTSFLEIGCGPARHALTLAKTGILEQCVGMDISKEMVEYARSAALDMGLETKTEFIQADMTDKDGLQRFVQHKDPFDAAAIMLGTFSHCLDNASAIQTLRNIAECVKPGGLLLIELGHPRDIFQGSFCSDGFVECWEVGESGDVDFADEEPLDEDEDVSDKDEDTAGGLRVMVEYGREGDRFDIDRHVLHRTVGMSLFDGADGSLLSSTVETVEQRQFTLQELDLLAMASGWHMCQPVYGDLDLSISLDDEESHRMVVLLQKNDSYIE